MQPRETSEKTQTLSASLAWGLLQLAGIPVSREGTLLVLPNVTLAVLPECSGRADSTPIQRTYDSQAGDVLPG